MSGCEILPTEKVGKILSLLIVHEISLGRHCLIPDISRTFHFGEDGLNVDRNMQGLYFRNHGFYQERDSGPVAFTPLEDLVKERYEAKLSETISKGSLNFSSLIIIS
jgi:hypothetical protein